MWMIAVSGRKRSDGPPIRGYLSPRRYLRDEGEASYTNLDFSDHTGLRFTLQPATIMRDSQSESRRDLRRPGRSPDCLVRVPVCRKLVSARFGGQLSVCLKKCS